MNKTLEKSWSDKHQILLELNNLQLLALKGLGEEMVALLTFKEERKQIHLLARDTKKWMIRQKMFLAEENNPNIPSLERIRMTMSS
jgi:hypothetical protein